MTISMQVTGGQLQREPHAPTPGPAVLVCARREPTASATAVLVIEALTAIQPLLSNTDVTVVWNVATASGSAVSRLAPSDRRR
jgi:hypothetical protein